MNPPCFTSSSTIEDLENIVRKLKKVFNLMHVIGVKRVDLAAYQLKNMARIWFDLWKLNRIDENAPHRNLDCFKEAFMVRLFP